MLPWILVDTSNKRSGRSRELRGLRELLRLQLAALHDQQRALTEQNNEAEQFPLCLYAFVFWSDRGITSIHFDQVQALWNFVEALRDRIDELESTLETLRRQTRLPRMSQWGPPYHSWLLSWIEIKTHLVREPSIVVFLRRRGSCVLEEYLLWVKLLGRE